MKRIATVFLFVTSFLILVQALPSAKWEEIHAARSKCIRKTLVNPSTVTKLRLGDYTINDPLLKDYAYCVYKVLALITSNGEIDKEAALKMISTHTDSTKFTTALDACKNQNGTAPEEKFWNYLVCFNNNYPKDIIVL